MKRGSLNFIMAVKLLSALTFLTYGFLCLFSKKMVGEFERYRLAQFRVLTGVLEITGALGQLGGFWVPSLGTAASGGLALLMICGLWTRWRIRDSWGSALPAFILFLLNSYLVWMEL